jgi:hypothetical protein
MDTEVVLSWVKIFGKVIEVALDGAKEEDCFARLVLQAANGQMDDDSDNMAFVRLMQTLGISKKVYHSIELMMHEIHGHAMRR